MSINLFAHSGLFLAITCFFLVILILVKKRTKLTFYWFLLKFAAAVWGISAFFIGQAASINEALFWWKVGISGVICAPVLFLHAVQIFCNTPNRTILIFAYIQAAVFLALVPTKYFFNEILLVFSSIYYPRVNGLLIPSCFLLWILLTFYAFLILFKNYKIATGIKRLQISYMLTGTFIFMVGGTSNFLPLFRIDLYPLGNLLVPFDCFLTTSAILSVHLVELRIAILRAVIFTFIYTVIICIPFYFRDNHNLWLYSTCLTVFLASAGPFVFIYLRRHLENVFLREQRHFQKTIRELSKKMTRIRNMQELLNTICQTVAETGNISSAAIYIKEEDYKAYHLKNFSPDNASQYPEFIPFNLSLIKKIEKQIKPVSSEELKITGLDDGLIVPFVLENTLLGFMILGKKKNSGIYTPDDLVIFESLSYSASLAIENCHFWKEIEDRQRKARLQEMDTYSYSLAHEIDNPMQVIIGEGWLLKNDFLKEISEQKKQDEASESFDYIMEAAQRVSGMVKAIRDFGQPTTGELRPINFDEVVESFERLYYPQLKTTTVVFEKICDNVTPIFVKGEKPALMQILVILANNAIHAMNDTAEKKITLLISIINENWLHIEFRDTGCGIKKELLSVIFTPFTTTKASSEGTGMGLYNAKMIIERHNGRIWAESQGQGKGAAIIIELPINPAPDAKEQNQNNKRLY